MLAGDARVRRLLEGLPAGADDTGIDLLALTGEDGPAATVPSRPAVDPAEPIPPARPWRRPVEPLRLVRWAAALAAAVATVWVLLPRPSDSPAPIVLMTAAGQRESFTLADGSTVELGPATRLEVCEGFGESDRNLRLEGQARFDVTPDKDRPFRVDAGRARVTVLGTTFGVRSYPGDDRTTVAVAEGTVKVQADDDDGQALAAGEAAELPAGDGSAGWVTRPVDEARDFAWLQDRLVFRGTPLSAVAADLERFYGITVLIEDGHAAGLRLDATFDREPADRVARTIGLALGLEVVAGGDTVSFRTFR